MTRLSDIGWRESYLGPDERFLEEIDLSIERTEAGWVATFNALGHHREPLGPGSLAVEEAQVLAVTVVKVRFEEAKERLRKALIATEHPSQKIFRAYHLETSPGVDPTNCACVARFTGHEPSLVPFYFVEKALDSLLRAERTRAIRLPENLEERVWDTLILRTQ